MPHFSYIYVGGKEDFLNLLFKIKILAMEYSPGDEVCLN